MREIQNTDEQTAAFNQMRASLRNPSASPGDRKMIMQLTKEGVSVNEMSSILNLQLGCVESLELEARRVLGLPLTEDEEKTCSVLKARTEASQKGVEYTPAKKMGRPPKVKDDE